MLRGASVAAEGVAAGRVGDCILCPENDETRSPLHPLLHPPRHHYSYLGTICRYLSYHTWYHDERRYLGTRYLPGT